MRGDMKTFLIFVLFATASVGAQECNAQRVGKEGNRAVGVLFPSDRKSFDPGEAKVWIQRRDEVTDSPNGDGIFCLVIPKYDPMFKLVYWAAGYQSKVSVAPIKNNSDPLKIEKISLHKLDAKDKGQLEMMDTLMESELAVYRGTKSSSVRRLMKEALMKLSEAIEIPPVDPNAPTLVENDRQMRIHARTSVDTVLAKMQ